MAKRFKLNETDRLEGQGVFFDANVLIYLFWPTGSHYWEEKYSRAFATLLRKSNPLFVDFLTVSEVINRVLRVEHQKLKPEQKFKEFRDSPTGKEALEDIHLLLKTDILNRFEIIGKSFSKSEILDYLIVNDLDFADKAIVHLCQEHNLILVTNDKDFKNSEIDILTGNPSILN
ncbi:PIN domain-containing protein [Algoriphagus sp. H41]|uniref:PIN domain-containing protein n=1 Tax=Algoriphagus oliviformis TaxID=2811231 RepID=A0ABS3C317_9BACT|nr:PIN domain-containing protein [Algoriphagus oliviformis]MBN7811505.1 PIN domain-containing protein [Algoriphagus oliviformis]